MRDKVYFDSCIWIAWLKNEKDQHGIDVIQGIRDIIQDAKNGKFQIVTSTITKVEVLECTLPEKVRGMFSNVLKHKWITRVSVLPKIADLAHEIRNHYKSVPDGQKTVFSMDAIHLATAIFSKAQRLYTLDGTSKRKRGLIPLGGWIAGKYRLDIVAPSPKPSSSENQKSLPGLEPDGNDRNTAPGET